MAEQTLAELVSLQAWLVVQLQHAGDHATVFDTLRAARGAKAVTARVATRLGVMLPAAEPMPAPLLPEQPLQLWFRALLVMACISVRLLALRPNLDVDDLRAGLALDDALDRLAETREAA